MTDPHRPTDPTHTPAVMHDIDKDVDDPVTLVIVFVLVAGLALVNIGLSTLIGPSKFTLPLQLMIASVQAGLVAYYFMHLRQGDRVVILTALSSLFWMGILFVLFMADYATRHRVIG